MRAFRYVLIILSLVAGSLPAIEPETSSEEALLLPKALTNFVEGKRLELNGEYQNALELYGKSVQEVPELNEPRVAQASLMLDLGMAEKAAALLEDREGLDWYGLRVRAIALAQMSGTSPEKLSKARRALEEVLEERANDPNVQFSLIRVLQVSGDPEDALPILRELRQQMAENPQLRLLEAQLLSSMGRPGEALPLYFKCADDNETCRQGVVDSLVALGRLGDAGEKLLGWLGPQDLDKMMQAAALLADGGRPKKALEVVDRVLSTASDSTEARRFKAILLVRLRRFREAAPVLDQLLRKDPANTDLLLAKAGVEAALNPDDMKKSRRYLDRAWATVSEDAGSRAAVGAALEASRVELDAAHPSVAREWLARVADPKLGGAQYLLLIAESYRQAEQYQAGVGALLRIEPQLEAAQRPLAIVLEADLGYAAASPGALSRLPSLLDSPDKATALMAVQELQNLGLWERVEEESRKLLIRFQGDETIRFMEATSLERLGRFEESVAVFEEILKENPENDAAANYLGYMLADADRDLQHALDLIQTAVAAEPENGAYLDSLGWVYYRMGKMPESILWLQKALRLSGDASPDIVAHLGEVMLLNGQREEGMRLLRRALDLGIEDAERVEKLIEGSQTGLRSGARP